MTENKDFFFVYYHLLLEMICFFLSLSLDVHTSTPD